MLLLDARREARFRDGDLVLLADQDRSLWDAGRIAAGRAALGRALALRGRGTYVVQAAIASLHADEPRDWPQIAALYGELARLTDSPVVELSRAVAVAETEGPASGLMMSSSPRTPGSGGGGPAIVTMTPPSRTVGTSVRVVSPPTVSNATSTPLTVSPTSCCV